MNLMETQLDTIRHNKTQLSHHTQYTTLTRRAYTRAISKIMDYGKSGEWEKDK